MATTFVTCARGLKVHLSNDGGDSTICGLSLETTNSILMQATRPTLREDFCLRCWGRDLG
jgi:hypothetical protein